MSTKLLHDEVINKVFNNNVVLVNSDEKEKILFAKGIGFAKKTGQVIKKGSEIDKVFTINEEQNKNNFTNILDVVDNGFFGVCEEAIYDIYRKTNVELNENIHIGLVNYLFYAVKRIKINEIVENPFLVEIEALYPKEFNLAKMVAKKVGEHENIDIPEGEIAFIALHIHSAMYNGSVSNTLKNNYLFSKIVKYIESKIEINIDKRSLDYARFITHLKFAIQRIVSKRNLENKLKNIIKETYKEAYEIAEGVAKIIENQLNLTVNEEEVTLLAVHIERFRVLEKVE